MATRAERYAKGKFTNPPHSRDGYSLPECADPRAKRVLEFLVPILYPEKTATVTVTVENTVFGAYTGEREVDWMLVIIVKQDHSQTNRFQPCPH